MEADCSCRIIAIMFYTLTHITMFYTFVHMIMYSCPYGVVLEISTGEQNKQPGMIDSITMKFISKLRLENNFLLKEVNKEIPWT